jgi:protein KRI1
MDDKSLNQIVGLKKLAPYRDDANDAAIDANQRARARRMAREFLSSKRGGGDKKKKRSRKSSKDDENDDDENDDDELELETRAASYADAAFGKKTKKTPNGGGPGGAGGLAPVVVGKNARKNAKKRAKRKAKEEAEAA